jgi:Spy/CpxP family protein refolding chaperone
MTRTFVLAAAAAMLLSGTGYGQEKAAERKVVVRSVQEGAGQGARMGMRQRGGPMRMAEDLALTDAQKKEMQKLATALQKKNIPVRSQIELARVEIKEQFASEKPDRAQIEKLMRQVSDLELQLKLNHLDHQFAVRGILDKDQLKKWHWQQGMGMERRVRNLRMGNAQPGMPGEPIEIEETVTIEEE